MKLFQKLVFAAGLCALAGCDGYGHRYAQSGPGSDIYSADQSTRSTQEDAYLGLMCDASGLPTERVNGAPTCDGLSAVDKSWTLVAQAGLNDIDARCDSYLAWLNDQKRAQKPIIKQLGTLSTVTGTIMHTAGAGGNAVTIVAQAFALVTDSYMNYTSRLILEVDHNTVTTLVRDKQRSFREQIAKQPIQTRPDVVNVIRSYLRICLPDSIESNINAHVVLAATGGGAAIDAAKERASRITLTTGVIGTSRAPLDKPAPKVVFADGLPASEIKKIQRLFCLAPDGVLGGGGSATRKTFNAYLVAKGTRSVDDGTRPIGTREWDLLRAAPALDPCPA